MQRCSKRSSTKFEAQTAVVIAVPATITPLVPAGFTRPGIIVRRNCQKFSILQAAGELVASKTFWQALHTTALIAAACL
jgi:hypothetical protein